MVKGYFLRSAALAAMVSAMTLAVPARAQDVDRSEMLEQRMERRGERQEAQPQQEPRQESRQRWQEGQNEAASDRQAQRASRQEWRQQRQAERVQAQQNLPQVQLTGSESDRRLDQYKEGTQRDRAWARSQSDARAPVTDGASGQDQRRGWRGRDGSPSTTVQGERNRTYTDGQRNGRYRDANRDGRADTLYSDRDGTHHSGYRDGRTADAYGDHRRQHGAYRNGYRSGSRDTHRSGHDRRWDNNWRRDSRYNWSSHRNQHRNTYRVGRYYSPYRNYSYSRLSIGFFVDRGFYGNNYWVNDPWQYRLPEVYGPYKWVRYYDDVILVDIYTGEVVDVIHKFFW